MNFKPPREQFSKQIVRVKSRVNKWAKSLEIPSVEEYIVQYAQNATPFPLCFPYICLNSDRTNLMDDLAEFMLTFQITTGTMDHIYEMTDEEYVRQATISIYFLSQRIEQIIKKLENKLNISLPTYIDGYTKRVSEVYFNFFNSQKNKSEFDYVKLLKLMEKRSSFLNGMACEMCGYVCGVERVRQNGLRTYGENISFAYAILDDIVDLPNDLMKKRLSYPILKYKKNKTVGWAQIVCECINDAIAISKKATNHISDIAIYPEWKLDYLKWLAEYHIPRNLTSCFIDIKWDDYIDNLEKSSNLFFVRNKCLSRIDNKKLTISSTKKFYFTVNPIGTEILRLCDGNTPINEIVEMIKSKFAENKNIIRKDTISFLSEMILQGLVDFYTNPCITPSENEKIYTESSPPKYIDWQITNQCTFDCEHCYQIKGEEKYTIEKEIAFKLIEEMSKYPIIHISITGGEPLLVPYIKELLNKISDIGAVCTLSTNGLLLNKDLIHFLSKNDINVQLSLDALKDTFDLHRHKIGAFKNVSANIKMLAEANVKTTIACTVTTLNKINVFKIIEHVKGLGVNSFRPIIFLPIKRVFKRNDLLLTYKEYLKITEAIVEKYHNPPFFEIHSPQLGVLSCKNKCVAGTELVGIFANGSVTPCPILDNNFVAGNVYDDNLTNIWFGKSMEKKRKIIHEIKNKQQNTDQFYEFNLYGICPAMLLALRG